MKYTRASISLPEPLLKSAKKNARKAQRNLSSYLASLIAEDHEALGREKATGTAGKK